MVASEKIGQPSLEPESIYDLNVERFLTVTVFQSPASSQSVKNIEEFKLYINTGQRGKNSTKMFVTFREWIFSWSDMVFWCVPININIYQ